MAIPGQSTEAKVKVSTAFFPNASRSSAPYSHVDLAFDCFFVVFGASPHPTFTEVRYNYPSHWFKCLVGYNIYTLSLVEYFNPCLFLCCVVVKCSTLEGFGWFSLNNITNEHRVKLFCKMDCTNSICFANQLCLAICFSGVLHCGSHKRH